MSTNTLTRDLTKGNINHQLFSLSFPLLLGVISAVLVNTADTFFVSQLGVNELAAMGYAFPIAMMGVGVAFGFGASAASIIGRTLGQGEAQSAKQQATYILVGSTLLVLAITLLGVAFIDPIIALLGVTEETFPLVKSYIVPWFIGLVFLVTPMVGTAILRGHGTTKVQSIVMIFAAVSNAILDPIFIFGVGSWEGWGVAGASWASVISRALTFVITVYFLLKPSPVASFAQLSLIDFLRTNRSLFRLGVPTSIVNVIAPVSVGFVTRTLSEFGDSAVAAFNIASRIDALLTIPAMALSMGVGAFVSQNSGAKKFERLQQAWGVIGKFALVWFTLVVIVVTVVGEPIISVFSESERTSEQAFLILLALSTSSIGTMLVPIFSSFQTAIGKASPSLYITIVRYFVLFIPGVYNGMTQLGLSGIVAGIFISQLASGLLAWIWGKKSLKTTRERSLAHG